jgi:hypothetical protein
MNIEVRDRHQASKCKSTYRSGGVKLLLAPPEARAPTALSLTGRGSNRRNKDESLGDSVSPFR